MNTPQDDLDSDALGTYLRRATRGLRARKRLEVTSELIGHIEARVQEFRLAGLGDAEALRQTLRELGEPLHVQRGMGRVYVWPSALRSTALLSALACGAVLLTLQLSTVLAQVQGYRPTFTPLPGPYTYVDTESLRGELRKAGVTVTGDVNQPVLTLPGQSAPIRVNASVSDLPIFVSRTLIRDYATGRSFLDLNAVVSAAVGAGVSARVEGWLNPKLHLGNVALYLGTPDQPLEAYNLYHVALNPLARTLGLTEARSSRQDDVNLFSVHTLTVPSTGTTGAAPGDTYALVAVQRLSPVWGRGTAPTLYFDLAQVGAGGKLNFRMPYDLATLRLTADPNTLKADAQRLRGGVALNDYATAAQPAHALLLKMSGQLDKNAYQVVPQNGLSVGEQQ